MRGYAPPLLMTKLHPPPRREQTVARDRLVERLGPKPGVRLTVVAAPAGCGKTTLLGTWRDVEASSRPIAWVTLDEGDNDPVVLWSHVLEALGRVCPGVGLSAAPASVGAARIVDVLLPALVNELVDQGDVSLILDDFDRLSSGAARDSVVWLVQHGPPTFHIVLSSRSEPPLPLGLLRARGDLLEVRADELSFTSDEAAALLNGRLDLGLASEEVDDLVDRTEGWPAGLYLAALSLQGVDDRHAFVGRFGGANRHVVDFLVDEVLEAHDPAMQSLMLRSSILGRLSGPLCDAVTERDDSGERLQALSRTNLFLVPLDDRGEWYRFHQLFAQLLRVELEHREPGLAPVLHRRAFAWHRDNGSIDVAIEHALEAGLFAEAAELIEAAWVHYVSLGRYQTVLTWFERFPPQVMRDDPRLLLVEAWVLSICARREQAAHAIAAVEELGGLEAGPLLDGFSSLEASLVTLRAAIPWGDIGGAIENGLRAAELEGPRSRWRAVVCCALGAAYYFSGELAEADRWLAEAAALAPVHGLWIHAVTSLAYRSRIAGEQGRLGVQTVLADQAAELARTRGLEYMHGEVLVASGASLAAQGKLGDALSHFERAVDVLRARGHPRDLADALIRRAMVLRAMNRFEAADAAAAEARAIVDTCPDPRVLGVRLAAVERPSRPQRPSHGSELSERELVILRMLRGSLSERDIGRELYLSHNTIHSHTKSIYRKLGVSSRSEAILHARGLGLL